MMAKLSFSARTYHAVTASDVTNFPRGYCDGIHANGAGDVALVGEDDVVAILTIEAGICYPYGAKRINATGTTATGITALYGG